MIICLEPLQKINDVRSKVFIFEKKNVGKHWQAVSLFAILPWTRQLPSITAIRDFLCARAEGSLQSAIQLRSDGTAKIEHMLATQSGWL